MHIRERLANWFGSNQSVSKDQLLHYKVMWLKRHPGAATVVMDYMAANMKELLRTLKEAESVSTANTSLLVVHQINADGNIIELLSHDEKTGVTSIDFRNSGQSATRTRTVQRGLSRQDEILKRVETVLNEARMEQQVPPVAKPHIKGKNSKKNPGKLKPFVLGGFLYSATAADDGTQGDPAKYSYRKETS